jgi:hypothetical protein
MMKGVVRTRKCERCGDILDQAEEGEVCLFCKNKEEEPKSKNDDIRRWKEREESSFW